MVGHTEVVPAEVILTLQALGRVIQSINAKDESYSLIALYLDVKPEQGMVLEA